MFYYLKIIAILLTLTLSAGKAFSVDVSDLYNSSVPLPDQSKETRSQGFKEALENVLIKVSGSQRSVLERDLVKLFKPYDSYVLSYSYLENPKYLEYINMLKIENDRAEGVDSDEIGADGTALQDVEFQNVDESLENALPIENIASNENNEVKSIEVNREAHEESRQNTSNLIQEIPKQYLLNVEFSKPSINRVLRQSGIRIWGKSRPSIITWLIAEEHGLRSVLNEYDSLSKLPEFKQNALNRGLQLYFPVADLEDQINTDVNLLWGMFEEGLPKKTGRYEYDIALIVVIDKISFIGNDPVDTKKDSKPSGEVVEQELNVQMNISEDISSEEMTTQKNEVEQVISLRWKLVSAINELDALTIERVIQDSPINSAVNQMLSEAAEVLAEKYAVSEVSSNKGGLKMVVTGVDDFDSFVEVQNYLNELPPISNIAIQKIVADTIEFNVSLFEGPDKLQQYIELGGRLKVYPVESSSNSVASEKLIHYIWDAKN